jgi:hypothetical protein
VPPLFLWAERDDFRGTHLWCAGVQRGSPQGYHALAEPRGDQGFEIGLWTGAEVRDDFGGADGTHRQAVGNRAPLRLACKKPGSK